MVLMNSERIWNCCLIVLTIRCLRMIKGILLTGMAILFRVVIQVLTGQGRWMVASQLLNGKVYISWTKRFIYTILPVAGFRTVIRPLLLHPVPAARKKRIILSIWLP